MLSSERFDSVVGQRLRSLLAERWAGTQGGFAAEVGANPVTVSRWLAGSLPLRSSSHLDRVAEVLGVGVHEILCGGAILREEAESLAELWDRDADAYERDGRDPEELKYLRRCAVQLREKIATPAPPDDGVDDLGSVGEEAADEIAEGGPPKSDEEDGEGPGDAVAP